MTPLKSGAILAPISQGMWRQCGKLYFCYLRYYLIVRLLNMETRF